MRKHSARIFEKRLQLLLPGHGRHRAADDRPAVRPQDETTTRTAPVRHAPAMAASAECVNAPDVPFHAHSWQPDGHGVGLTRPYVVVAYERQRKQREQRVERRLRRRRRQALWLAVHGVDVGPRWIHGVRVVA
ncbi:hypothetical protein ACH4U7_36835 [Streptomyces sp. NPDC020845]|uniref:hypothetical protein n=1 Tax=Streptomyces sp. NPDC020845 TaxID=3365096 RepID=UPI0037A8EC34